MPSHRVFIGSSSESLRLALDVQRRVQERGASATVWTEAFSPGQQLLPAILNLVREFDFGIFVFSPDDVTLIRAKGQQTVRDNVLFEAGVFMGGLGPERTFVLAPRGRGSQAHIPTDLAGFLTATYRPGASGPAGRTEGLEHALDKILTAIERLGPAPRNPYNEIAALSRTLDECEFKVGKRSFVLGDLVRVAERSARRSRPWHQNVDVKDLCRPILAKHGDVVTDTVYWWLIVHGVLRFRGIERFIGDSWKWSSSIEFASLSERGVALLNSFASSTRDAQKRRLSKDR